MIEGADGNMYTFSFEYNNEMVYMFPSAPFIMNGLYYNRFFNCSKRFLETSFPLWKLLWLISGLRIKDSTLSAQYVYCVVLGEAIKHQRKPQQFFKIWIHLNLAHIDEKSITILFLNFQDTFFIIWLLKFNIVKSRLVIWLP